jgi:hypothetical protein
MTCSNSVGFARLPELFLGVLTDSLQKTVSRWLRRTFGDDERFVDEKHQLVQDLIPLDLAAAADDFRSVQVEAAHERRQPPKQDALGIGKQCVRPVHRRS